MLLFIDICKALILLQLRFQYISCYCLSDSADDNSNRSKKFQYISCYCLSNPIARIPIPEHHFNTSHVTVYRLAGYVIHDNSLNFNTSHVTVYPEGMAESFEETSFQYISCYCLSYLIHLKQYQLSLFQYISCYCLSNQHPTLMRDLANFNTSHVTVYRKLCTK